MPGNIVLPATEEQASVAIRKAYEQARKTFNDRMSDEIELQRVLAETR